MTTDQVNKQFWTIERFVAFVLTPAATAGSGFVAAWLGKHAVHVSGDGVYAFASATSLSVAGGIIKWLDGRSKHTLQQVGGIERAITGVATPLLGALPEPVRQSLLADIKGIVANEANKLGDIVAKATGQQATTVSGGDVQTAPVEHPAPTEPAPTWSSPNDPAPETPPPASTAPPAPAEAPPATAVVGDAGTPDIVAPPAPAADAGAAPQGS